MKKTYDIVVNAIIEMTAMSEADIKPEFILSDALDSLDMVELQMYLEEDFSITVPDGTIAECKTVLDLCNLIDKLRG